MNRKKFGVAVKKLRKLRGLTKNKLAKKADLSVNDIIAIEAGEREIGTLLPKLAKALKLPVPCLKIMGIEYKKNKEVDNFAVSLVDLIFAIAEAQGR